MKYEILESLMGANYLSQDVNEKIKDGWEPIGGVAIAVLGEKYGEYHHAYVQAMVKKESGDNGQTVGAIIKIEGACADAES